MSVDLAYTLMPIVAYRGLVASICDTSTVGNRLVICKGKSITPYWDVDKYERVVWTMTASSNAKCCRVI